MAETNFKVRQGETWSRVISFQDSDCIPTLIASETLVPTMYFAGTATKTGQTSVPIYFSYEDIETKTYGRGVSKSTKTGIFGVKIYIPADEVGSCSDDSYKSRLACASNGETWTVDTAKSDLTTSKMEAGVWKYEIRIANAVNTANTDSSRTILYGNLTIEESSLNTTTAFEFSTPA